MMHLTERKHRWGQKAQRGVSPIIATILLVAITVVLAAVLYILISGLTKGPGNTPIGTQLAVSPAKESTAGTTNWYNFTVQSAGGGLQLSNLVFQVRTTNGAFVSLPGASTMTVIGLTGATVGTYTISSGTWASGGSTSVSNQQQIILTTPSTTSLSGDVLVILGSGTFSGSIQATIP
jgi:archaeal type IV pilus assembly protein PilA